MQELFSAPQPNQKVLPKGERLKRGHNPSNLPLNGKVKEELFSDFIFRTNVQLLIRLFYLLLNISIFVEIFNFKIQFLILNHFFFNLADF